MHHGPINDRSSAVIIKAASIKENEHVLQELFQWPPLHSPPIQLERNERPLLCVFIWLNDCWMDWSQLIRQWQEALLLAQWPTPTKDRNHQQNTHWPQIDFWIPAKPRRCHSKPAVSHFDTFTWPQRLNSAETRDEQVQNFFPHLSHKWHKFNQCTNEMQQSCVISLNLDEALVKFLKGLCR